jgi:uncharacterized membrane protein YeiH
VNSEVLTPLLDWLDLVGVAIFALTGALVAAKERQTFVTLAFFALITGVETGEVISSIKNLNTGDRINTRFSQGQVVSQIKEIKS